MSEEAEQDIQTPESREATYSEFVALLARSDPSIRRFVRSLLPSSCNVDDLMQEIALECWKKFPSFAAERERDAANEFIRWMCVIARYKVLAWRRDRARDRLVFRESVIEQLAEPAMVHLERRDSERRAIEQCLERLPHEERRLILSLYSPGESIARLAKETGTRARRLYSKANVLRQLLLECVQQRLTREFANG